MANTSEAISHQVAVAIAEKAEKKRAREPEGAHLAKTKVAASAKTFSILYNKHLRFGHLAALAAFQHFDLCRFMAKRQLQSQLLVASKQIDQVMLAIESSLLIDTATILLHPYPHYAFTHVIAMTSQMCLCVCVCKQLLKKPLEGQNILKSSAFFVYEMFNDLSSYSETSFTTFLQLFKVFKNTMSQCPSD